MPRVWLAHGLTLSRVPLALALWWSWGDPARSVGLLVLAAISDAADGMVARWAKRHGSTGPDIGGWLDPAVDKLFVVVVLAAIWTHTHQLALLALVGARELVLVPLIALHLAFQRAFQLRGRELRADRLGKLATIAQFVALCVIAIAPEGALPTAIVAAVLGLAAAGHYVVTATTSCNDPVARPRA
ncbi:MAG TPA: CDP-alcohol phosphatidyltransferase family protein [Kofleriaceae bacterium]|nr:CDP-alcohol phosphatidyltransferase family protein [Kofleriaceae bacterium]